MIENNQKNTNLFIYFISYNKFSSSEIKIISKKFNKLILLFWLLKKNKNIRFLKLLGLQKFKKFFTLLKSPKGYKTGKLTLNYQYYKFLLIINLLNKDIYLGNINKYFIYFLNFFKHIDTNYIINYKVKLNTNINIEFKVI